MYSDSIPVVHLIELVDADDSPIGQYHGTGFEVPVARVAVYDDGGGEADRGRAAPGGVDAEGRDVEDVAEELRLGGGGVAYHHDVDVATEVGAVFEDFFRAAEELQEQGFLHAQVTFDRRSYTRSKDVEQVLITSKFLDILNVGITHRWLFLLCQQTSDPRRHNIRFIDAVSQPIECSTFGAKYSIHLNPVPRFQLIN